jgi:hypothetical protein
MKKATLNLVALAIPLAGALYLTQAGSARSNCFFGMCDASAVVALDNEFFAVADDEETLLRVYSRRAPGRAAYTLELAPFLGLPRRGAEVDLEGGARLGNRIYWISSHGCNAEGKEQPSRRRFFATTGTITNGLIDLRPIGRPYHQLLQDLIREPRLAAFGLADAARRMPKAPDALNIEGLCATPDGQLLIGFRNPIPAGRALIVPLLNPAQVIETGTPARFGEPILLELGGLGIRSLAYRQNRYWIVAGSHDGEMASLLCEWDGHSTAPRPLVFEQLTGLNPESITFFAGREGNELWVVSDDGTVKINGRDCKRLKDSQAKRFRAVAISVGDVSDSMTAQR